MRLPDCFEVKEHKLTGAIELHWLAVQDFAQLERRTDEINNAIIDASCALCSVNGGYTKVRQAPLPFSPGYSTVSCLHVRKLPLSTPAAEQGC